MSRRERIVERLIPAVEQDLADRGRDDDGHDADRGPDQPFADRRSHQRPFYRRHLVMQAAGFDGHGDRLNGGLIVHLVSLTEILAFMCDAEPDEESRRPPLPNQSASPERQTRRVFPGEASFQLDHEGFTWRDDAAAPPASTRRLSAVGDRDFGHLDVGSAMDTMPVLPDTVHSTLVSVAG
jgi:hypothetical protein